MRPALALAAAAVLVTSCGSSKPAESAAEVAPSQTYLLVEGRPSPATERALAFLPDWPRLERLLRRATRLTGAGRRPALVVLDGAGTRAAALVRPADRGRLDEQLDRAGLVHARVRGWTVFSHQQSAVDAVREAKQHLADTSGLRRVEGDVAFQRRTGSVTASATANGATATQTEPPRGEDAAHPLAAAIPADAVAAAAVHDGARVFSSLPFAAQLTEGIGVRASTLAAAAPRDAALYARAAIPAAVVTLLARGDDVSGARRVVRELAPNGAGQPGTVGGTPATDVPLGPVDLYYGRLGRTVFVTEDEAATLRPGADALAPAGLPPETREWAYLDVPRGLPALQSLAALSGTRLSAAFTARVARVRTLLAYRTRGATTVVVTR